jgi:hypothetical protein
LSVFDGEALRAYFGLIGKDNFWQRIFRLPAQIDAPKVREPDFPSGGQGASIKFARRIVMENRQPYLIDAYLNNLVQSGATGFLGQQKRNTFHNRLILTNYENTIPVRVKVQIS